MRKKNEYSIWLMPSDDDHDYFDKIITNLNDKHKTPYFLPHITLLSGATEKIEIIIKKTLSLSSSIIPMMINLGELSNTEEYYKSIYIDVKKTRQIMEAHNKAIKKYKPKNCTNYTPHLSLMYSTFNEKQRIDITEELKSCKYKTEFTIKHISIVSTNGPPELWEIIKYI